MISSKIIPTRQKLYTLCLLLFIGCTGLVLPGDAVAA